MQKIKRIPLKPEKKQKTKQVLDLVDINFK
jgi:hypothetical protein